MSKSSEEPKDSKSQNSTKPMGEWSEQELMNALAKVSKKQREDWTSDDMAILAEDTQRKIVQKLSSLNTLKANSQFNIEEWIRFLADTAVDIYFVAKGMELGDKVASHNLAVINQRLSLIQGELSTRPSAVPPHVVVDLSDVEARLNQILSLLQIRRV